MPSNNQELSELDDAAQEAYEHAAADGLCEIGALEVAHASSRTVKVESVSDPNNTSA